MNKNKHTCSKKAKLYKQIWGNIVCVDEHTNNAFAQGLYLLAHKDSNRALYNE